MPRSNPLPLRSLLLFGLLLPLLGGCVSQNDWDRLYEENRTYKERNEILARERDEARNSLHLVQGKNAQLESALDALRRQYGDATGQLDRLLREYDALGNRISGLQFSELDPETDRMLSELARQYPDLIIYDSATGMLRFAADLTFDSGSDAVRESAKAPIAQLAKILTSAAATQYEVVVVGHTDSQRISARTAQRHPTNMHLSAHRAISVRNELVGLGVAAPKIQAAGWGEFRPLVPNTPSGNTPQNRRVEIFLRRATGDVSTPPPQAPASAPAPTPRTPEIVK